MWKLLELPQVASQKELVLLSCVYNFIGDHPLEMNHHDRSGDSGSARKMVHPMSLPKRDSSVGGSSTLTTSGSTILNSNNLMLGDDYSSPVLIQSQTPAAPSLGSQNPPQSLNIPVQTTLLPQTLPPTTVAQMKKKSGFQITSVTPAQTSVSTNNSIAEDTESCDDLDESHTEDLSSSEIMDVSLSRANNAGGPERSSSEETLNNFHEAETPGAVSPNQPPVLTQAHMHGSMVNGTVHHHHHNPASSGKSHLAGGTQIGISGGAAVTSAVTSSSVCTGQKMPSNVVGFIESSSVGSTAVIGPPLASVASGTGMISVTSGATVSTGKPITNNVSVLNSASVPVVGGKSTNSSSVNYSPALNSISNQIVNLTRIPSGIIGKGVTAATTVSVGVASTGGGLVGPAVMGQHAVSAPSVPSKNAQPQQAQVPPPASTSSRFRVVKLDSTSEPFKKGRWTCTEYYDKEAPNVSSSSSENPPSTRSVESIRQFVPESVACQDRESVSSTASHYTESLGSGDAGGPCLTFQQPAAQKHDYSSTHNVSQMQPQDLVHAHLQTNAVAPSIQPSTNMGALQTTIGHPTHMPKLTYAQAAQSPPAQALPVVTQQQMGYPPTQQPAQPSQVAPAHINPLNQGGSLPPDFPQPKQIMKTVPPGSTQTLPHLSALIPLVAGNSQLIAASQQPVGSVPPPAAQPLPQGLLQPQQTPAPQMVQLVQPAGASLIQQTQGQQLAPQPSMEQQQSQLSSRGHGTQFVPAVTSSNVPPNLQSDSSLIQNGSKDPGPAVSTLSSVMPTLQEDAQLLLQHPALLTQPKPAGAEAASQVITSRGPEGSGGVNALTASASLLKSLPVDGEDDGSSGASVVAIDNKIEQAMDLVKSHLMYAVREEVEVLKEQIKELIERNSQLEQENNLLKNLASPEQLAQFQAQVQSGSPPPPSSTQTPAPPAQLTAQTSGPSA
ncbi:TSC22 domain family protein 1 isoform X1 [Carassius auratus]|uniref:TSC22 domain family protein 1 n=1 Tax=Carassius auratus TaxID=7957 RepID=A0A6P6Q4B6_CARAU|nr:TSC22 domain family protein 1-like isoform X1 [Carassius auratus]